MVDSACGIFCSSPSRVVKVEQRPLIGDMASMQSVHHVIHSAADVREGLADAWNADGSLPCCADPAGARSQASQHGGTDGQAFAAQHRCRAIARQQHFTA